VLLFVTPFCAIVVLASYALQSAGGVMARRAAHTARGSSVPDATTLSSPQTTDSSDEYQIISRRNLFRPLVERKKPRVQRSIQRYLPPANFGRLEPLQPLVRPMPVQPLQPSPTRPQPPSSPTGGVTVVGTVNVNGVMHGVVEDTARGESRFIRVGETAFGFRLAQIDDERAVLERDGKTHILNLGAHKEDKPMRPPAASQNQNAAQAALTETLARVGGRLDSPNGETLRQGVVQNDQSQ
jgi:hypothetical protein